MRTPVVPHRKCPWFPSYATAILRIDDKLIQVIKQGLTFFLRHVFKTKGIGRVDPERWTVCDRVQAHHRVYLGARFLVIVVDRHIL